MQKKMDPNVLKQKALEAKEEEVMQNAPTQIPYLICFTYLHIVSRLEREKIEKNVQFLKKKSEIGKKHY